MLQLRLLFVYDVVETVAVRSPFIYTLYPVAPDTDDHERDTLVCVADGV